MQLLLFLSAMLAGLISGDRAVDLRQVERTAVAASASVELGEAAQAAALVAVSPVAVAPAWPDAGLPRPVAQGPEPLQAAPVDERRLE